MPSLTICNEPGCATPVPRGKCPEHKRQADKARGSSTQRGYGGSHQRRRAAAIANAKPTDPCTRCGQPIGCDPTTLDLDHTDDRTDYRGLAHATCNRGARTTPGG